ncbi:MAG: hypothetical protein M1365_15765, partial [Actinobacteria bacterium]|nr:hypothetical protein [Actinomycetota bacterium]
KSSCSTCGNSPIQCSDKRIIFISHPICNTQSHPNYKRKTIVEARHGYGAISYKQGGQITLFSVVNYLWYHFKLSIGWYSNRPIVILTFSFVVWMGLGIAYGMTYENYSFITALYWAVTTCATGGLQSPPCLNISPDGICDMGNTRGGLMGVFMMIGVPLYAFTLAQFSRLVVGFIVYARQDEQMNQPIEDVDFIFAANVLSPEGSVTLVLGEYILLELMRMGQTNRHQIESIKKKFYQLDKLKRGELDIDDLIKIGKVVKRKVHSIEKPNNNSKLRTRSMELFDMAGIVRRVSNSHIDTGSILSSLGIAMTPPKQSFSASSVTTDALQPKREEDKKILDNPDLILSENRRHNKKTFRKSIRNSQYLTQVQWADPEHGIHLNIPGEDYSHRVHAQEFPEFESFDFNIDDLESSTYPRSNNLSQSSSPLTIEVNHFHENYDLKDRIPFPVVEYETPKRSSHVSIHYPFLPIEEKPGEEEEDKDDEEDFIPNHFLEENNIDVNVDV